MHSAISNIIIISILIPILVGIFSYIVKIYVDNYFLQKNLFCGIMVYDVFLGFIKSGDNKKIWNEDIAFSVSFTIRRTNIAHLEYINTIKFNELKISNSNLILKDIEIIYFMDRINKNIILFIKDYDTNLELFKNIYRNQTKYFGNKLNDHKTLNKNFKKLLMRRRKHIIIPGLEKLIKNIEE